GGSAHSAHSRRESLAGPRDTSRGCVTKCMADMGREGNNNACVMCVCVCVCECVVRCVCVCASMGVCGMCQCRHTTDTEQRERKQQIFTVSLGQGRVNNKKKRAEKNKIL